MNRTITLEDEMNTYIHILQAIISYLHQISNAVRVTELLLGTMVWKETPRKMRAPLKCIYCTGDVNRYCGTSCIQLGVRAVSSHLVLSCLAWSVL